MLANRWHYKDFLKIALHGFPRLGIGSVDVTYRCNLDCKHCYFKGQKHKQEQPLSFWVDKFEELKHNRFPFYICGWLGGEPLLRPEVVELGRRYFKSNIIFTNGTLPLPHWPECTFVVSVHGTAPYYSIMTGTDEKTYLRVKSHADRPDLRVYVSFCVTAINKHCVESFVEEWRETGIKGVVFEFYTPTNSPRDPDLVLSWKERDLVLEKIRKLKNRYGEFIYNSSLTLKLMYSHRARRITEKCPFLRIGFSFDPLGREKAQCTLGAQADCRRCGCILPFFSEILSKPRYLYREFLSSALTELGRAIRGEPAFHLLK